MDIESMTKERQEEIKKEKEALPDTLTNKQKNMLLALSATMNNVAKAVKIAGISRNTHYAWINNDKDDTYKKEVEARREAEIDLVESALKKNIFKGNVVAQIFYLKSKAKHRGYVEKVETEEVGDKVVTHLYIPDNGRRRKKD